jgi:type VI secretion system secreted protein Hcp
LVKYCSSGKHIPEVKISLCKAGGDQIEYSSTVLKDVLVTTAAVSGAGTNQLIGMHYSFQGAQVEHHYWKQNSDGTKGAESQFMWDVKRNVSM